MLEEEGDRVGNEVKHKAEIEPSFPSYWQLIGKVVSFYSIPLIGFTALFGLKLDGYIKWNYWIIFSPILFLLLFSLLLSSSQRLTAPAPPQVRITWILWVVSIGTFIILMIMKLQNDTTLSLVEVFVPLYIIAGIVLISGFYVAFIIGCCKKTKNPRKYILSGAPLFCFGIILLPVVFLISFKEGVEFTGSFDVSWAIVFIPLFVADGFCFCMGFFLLLFSFGGQNGALFSLSQLFIFLAVVPASVTFKILLILKLDGVLNVSVIIVFAPLFVLELLFLACGLNVGFGRKLKTGPLERKDGYRQVSTKP